MSSPGAPDTCITSHSPEQTRELGERLAPLLRGGDVVGLSGELGAGKTCLVQGLATGLGVDPAVPVTSPTFTLVGEYAGRALELRHADFYRVEHAQRLWEAGFDDLMDARGVLVVEWPERFPDALPKERVQLEIAAVSPSERRIRIGGQGARADEIARRLAERWDS